MKRLVSVISVLVLLVVAGGLASACQASPPAGSVNGATIQMGTLNNELRAYETTQAGACLLTIETGGQRRAGPGSRGRWDL